MHGGQVGGRKRPVVQGCSDEHRIEPHVRELLELPHGGHAAAGEKLHVRVRTTERVEQHHVHALRAADAREVEHQERRSSCRGRRAGEIGRGLPLPGWTERLPAGEIEREDNAVRPDRVDHGGERIERGKGFETHYGPVHAIGQQLTSAGRSGDRRIDEQTTAHPSKFSQDVTLHRATGEGVEVGDIAFVAAERVVVGDNQRACVARRLDEGRANGYVRLAPAAASRDRHPASEVEHGNYTHRSAPPLEPSWT